MIDIVYWVYWLITAGGLPYFCANYASFSSVAQELTGSATHAICSEFGFLFSESNNKVDKKRLMFAL